MVLTIILLLAISLGLYLLYICGHVAVQMKRALLYVGSIRGDKARFSGCTGYVRRRFPVAESRTYRLNLALELSRGEVSAELLGRDRIPLLMLDERCGCVEIPLERGRVYHLVIRYRSASGKHELTYE